MTATGRGRRHAPLHDIAGPLTPYLYLAPTAILTVVFVIGPFLANIYYSLAAWDGFGPMRFIGLGNYIRLMTDARFHAALITNLTYVATSALIPTVFGLGLASMLARTRVRGMRIFQTVYFLPQVVSAIALGTVFRWIYAPHFGVLDHLLRVAGLQGWRRPWLGSPETAPLATGFIGTWAWLGFCVLIFVAGIQKIDEQLYEAAKLDGAGSWRQFRHVTLPELRFEIVVVLVITAIRALGGYVFALVSVTTGGAHGTRPIGLYAYQLAFVEGQLGYASAVVMALTLLILAVSGLSVLVGERR